MITAIILTAIAIFAILFYFANVLFYYWLDNYFIPVLDAERREKVLKGKENGKEQKSR